MNDLHLDESNDIHADGGRIVRTTTLAQSVGQAALCAMRTEEGEAFADPEEGVPWFGQIMGLPATHLDIAVSIIRDRLEGIRGVRKVDSVEIRMPADVKPGIMRNIGGRVRLTAEDGSTATEEF